MENIKYEAVFGPQELFEGMMDDCEFVRGDYGYKIEDEKLFYCEKHNQKYGWCKSNDSVLALSPVSTMRRIIRTPTWSVADQNAGKLPPVGSRYLGKDGKELTCVLIDAFYDVWGVNEDLTMFVWERSRISPIESPEEKAARLREEWCNKAAKQLKNLEYSSTLTSIYDALLSGDLPVPVKGE